MNTQLFLCVNNLRHDITEEVNFFQTGKWDMETEKNLLHHIQELLATVRPYSRSLKIVFNVEAENIPGLITDINKKLKKGFEFNDKKLSAREIEILGLIMQGYTNKEISEKLFIGFETVRTHRKHILEKTGASNTAALINYYHQTFFDKEQV